ncbi:hypothetical protein CBF96_02505 [Limosilactobacillus reuteri]|uniref:Uncharacterized protein n=2 Tax=Limosilactobacillus reuteri TaxID=1598 RepID=A0A256SU42_LIMRT|nr:hypothetical protein CBF96_02505 [Limosilactobacillus reuteri]
MYTDMKNKHEPSNFELQQEIKQLKEKLDKLNTSSSSKVEANNPKKWQLVTFFVLSSMFIVFSLIVALTNINDLASLSQFLVSLVLFSMGLVISELKK